MEINEDNLLKAKHSVNIVDRRIRWMNERFVSEESLKNSWIKLFEHE